ncbi:DUF2304 domain-containing protein [Mycetocola saprophilus]|uniref:DUF2304 domain-containing protein n=1 Tax=Mycetocola saprophilus TaxID=76636 RepID=UPI0004BEBA4F|nr:DUF2304 domain-containing protein [Mycetocola saprophilus]
MNFLPQLLGILAAVLILAVVIEMLRRRRMRERHAFWWLGAGLIALIAGAFPSLLDGIAGALGIAVPLNLVFFASAAVLFLVCLQHSSELSEQEERLRTLTEEAALANERVRALTERVEALEGDSPRPGAAD